jgi:hypothetical protein
MAASHTALSAAAERTSALAKSHGCTLAIVESCTAGALAALLADAPGASDLFHGGFVVYTKVNKTAAVGVPPDLIKVHTAVSREVVLAMADGVLERCPADIVLAMPAWRAPIPMRTAIGGPAPRGRHVAQRRDAASRTPLWPGVETRHLPSRDTSRPKLGR